MLEERNAAEIELRRKVRLETTQVCIPFEPHLREIVFKRRVPFVHPSRIMCVLTDGAIKQEMEKIMKQQLEAANRDIAAAKAELDKVLPSTKPIRFPATSC